MLDLKGNLMLVRRELEVIQSMYQTQRSYKIIKCRPNSCVYKVVFSIYITYWLSPASKIIIQNTHVVSPVSQAKYFQSFHKYTYGKPHLTGSQKFFMLLRLCLGQTKDNPAFKFAFSIVYFKSLHIPILATNTSGGLLLDQKHHSMTK